MLLIAISLLSLQSWAQLTITSCATHEVDATSVQIKCTASSAAYINVEYGTTAETYPNRSKDSLEQATYLRKYLGGLKPSTTYYARIAARASASPTTADAYSSEFSFTTTAAPSSNWGVTAPTTWEPAAPDTSGYTTILMKECSSGYPCADGNQGDVDDEDGFQTVLDTVGYGTIIEFPASMEANMEVRNGYELPAKAAQAGKTGIDDATHDWIIIQTAGCETSAFAPFGSRLQRGSTAAVLRATAPNDDNRAQHFLVNHATAHHYWVRCMRLAGPGTTPDGTQFRHSILVSQDFDTEDTADPRYFVFDRIHIDGLEFATQTWKAGIKFGARYFAVIGCVIEAGWVTSNGANQTFGLEGGYRATGPVTIRNNYITASMGYYSGDSYDDTLYDDVVFEKNWVNRPPSQVKGSPSWDGRDYTARNQWEIKGGRRHQLVGNLFTGGFAQQATGAIAMFGRGHYGAEAGIGISDILVRSNTIAHAASGLNCSGNGDAGTDPVLPKRIVFENNLVYDLNMAYSISGASLDTSFLRMYQGCQQVRLSNNTMYGQTGLAPLLFLVGGNSARSGLFAFSNNLVNYNSGDSGCFRYGTWLDDTVDGGGGDLARLPALASNDETTISTRLDSYYATIGPGDTVTASYAIANNLMIAGKCFTAGTGTGTDIDASTTATLADGFPVGQFWPTGATEAARNAVAGFSTTSYVLFDDSTYRRASGDKFNPLGVRHDVLMDDQGVVRDINVWAAGTAIIATYRAPDRSACYLDASADGSTWTRASDGGGSVWRTAIVAGLDASTAHTWRLWCYYQQVNDGRQWDDWEATRITTGGVTTGASGTRSYSVAYDHSSISGAAKARITVTDAAGSDYATSCSTSPCTASSIPTTSYRYRIDALSTADAVLVVGDWQAIR